MSLRSDDLDPISELYIEDDFRQLVLPISFSSLGELEDRGERGLESAFTRPYFKSSELGASHEQQIRTRADACTVQLTGAG